MTCTGACSRWSARRESCRGPGAWSASTVARSISTPPAPGTILLKVRYSSAWTLVQGQGCLRQTSGGWTAINATQHGQIRLQLRLVHPETDDTC